MASAKATVDHETIRHWVEKHGGCPAHVKSTGSQQDPGILRIDFPGFSGQQSLEQISWDEFFTEFERRQLALLYEPSGLFSKIVGRDTAEQRARGEHHAHR